MFYNKKNFENFAKTCSKKFHCTIFGATNHPSALGVDVKQTFPVIISVDPPNEKGTIEVFQHYLRGKPVIGNINYETLADTLIKTGKERGGIYSNSQIKRSLIILSEPAMKRKV